MKRHFLIFPALLCLLLLAPLSPAAAKDTWTSVRSKNFLLVGNASEKDIRRVATRLEQFRDVLGRLLKKANLTSATPTTVVVFKNQSAYKQYAPPGSAGYFQAGEDVNYIALSGAETGSDNPYAQTAFNVIFHEFVHLLVKNNLQNVPTWFNEGLAEYYSTLEVLDGDKKVQIGKPIANHVLYLRDQKLLPLRTLLEVDHRAPYYNESNKASVFYAQSWALLHYLLLGNNAKRQPQFNTFINLLMAEKPIDEAFQQAFQTDFATVEKELKEYIRRDTYPAQVATFERKLEFDAEMQSAPLAEAEGQAYLGDLLLHAHQLDRAEQHLQQAVKLDPQLAVAEASLGMLYLRKDNFAEARRHLQRAVALNSQNYLAHYYYAYVLSHEGMNVGNVVSRYAPETAQTMRDELKKTIELAPTYAQAYHLLAIVNLVGDKFDEAVANINRAIALSPGDLEYKFMLAQIYMHKQDFPPARKLLETIVRKAEPEVRARAQSLLETIANIEAQLARYKANASAAASGSAPAPANQTGGAGRGGDARLDQPASGLPLRQPLPGEEQVRGLLVGIDCSSANIILTVRVGDRLLKFQRSHLEEIDFVTFAAEISGEITCGPRKPENPVIITYRPTKNGRSKFDGEVLVVSFVPKEMLDK